MPASMCINTPSGADSGVSTSSKRKSLCACSRQALWVFVIAIIPLSSRPSEARAGIHNPDANVVRGWSNIQLDNKGVWLWVPAFAGTTRGEVFACGGRVVAFDFIRQFDQHTSAGKIDSRHHRVGERQQHGRAGGRRDLDDVAGAEIVDRDDLAERLAARGDGGQSDQVGVVIFVVRGRRQFFTRDVELEAVEPL